MSEQIEKPVVVNEAEKETSYSDYEEEYAFFQDITMLESYEIATGDIEKLKAAGLNTIKSVQMIMKKNLIKLTGLDDEKIEKVREACAKISENMIFVTALDFSSQRKQIFRITTGSKSLDKLLGGGVESMSITEVFGEFGTGKTQLAHTLCITAQIPGAGNYIGGKVMFIDTEHTFRPERLRSICDRFNVDQVVALQNVLYARAYNSEHQYQLLDAVSRKFHEEAGVFKLLIVDSIIALFRTDFEGISEIAQRQHKLGAMLSRLQKISEEFNICVFITNQICSDIRKFDQTDTSKPIGGNILAHASTTRVSFKKTDGGGRIATVYDSPDVAENEAGFAITSGGIADC